MLITELKMTIRTQNYAFRVWFGMIYRCSSAIIVRLSSITAGAVKPWKRRIWGRNRTDLHQSTMCILITKCKMVHSARMLRSVAPFNGGVKLIERERVVKKCPQNKKRAEIVASSLEQRFVNSNGTLEVCWHPFSRHNSSRKTETNSSIMTLIPRILIFKCYRKGQFSLIAISADTPLSFIHIAISKERKMMTRGKIIEIFKISVAILAKDNLNHVLTFK